MRNLGNRRTPMGEQKFESTLGTIIMEMVPIGDNERTCTRPIGHTQYYVRGLFKNNNISHILFSKIFDSFQEAKTFFEEYKNKLL